MFEANPGGFAYVISNTVNFALATDSVFNALNPGNAGSIVRLDGIISGPGCSFTKTGPGALVFNGANTYDGPTTVSAGMLFVAAPGSLGGIGQNVTVSNGATLGFLGMPLTQSMLTNRITAASAGALAMGASTTNDLDFTGLATRLGTVTNATFSGTLTPNGSTYKLGPCAGVLTIVTTNVFSDDGGARSVDIDLANWAYTLPKVVLATTNTYSGGTSVRSKDASALDVELGTPAALGSGPITLRSGGLYYNTPGAMEMVVTNDIAFTNSVATQVGLSWSTNITFTGSFLVSSNIDILLNRQGNNTTIVSLPPMGGQPGKLTIGRGMIVMSNTNLLPLGNFNACFDTGMLLFDGVPWSQFVAARTNGFGTGSGQWQVTVNASLRIGARGAPLVIDAQSIPGYNPATYVDAANVRISSYFDRGVYLGSALTRNGQLVADAPVTIGINTLLSGRRSWGVAGTGPRLYGTHSNGVTHRVEGNISDPFKQGLSTNRGCISQFLGATGGELVLAGTNDWTASPYTDDMGSPVRTFCAGPGGLASGRQAGDDILIRFDGAQSLPRGTGSDPAYLSAVGKGTAGYLFTARPGGETYEPFPGFRFVLGGTAAGVLGSSGLPGWAAVLLGADVATHHVTNGNSANLITLVLPVRGGTFTLGDAGKPVTFIPTYGMEAINGDPGLVAPATTLYDASLITGKLVKVNAGTLILKNVAYTDLAKTGNKAGQYTWQIGRASGWNAGLTAYSDGAVRGLADNDPLADDSNSLKSFNINLRGGVYEVDGRGAASAFTRSVGTAANQVQWVADGGGGFAAYDGPLTVNIAGDGSQQTWGTFAAVNSALIFGSETANDRVSLVNPLSLASSTREIRVLDNTNAVADRAVLLGAVSSGGSLVKAGPGILELAAVNTFSGTTAVTNGTLMVNGTLNAQSSAVTVYSAGTLSGTGVVARPVSVVPGGRLAPGDLGIGTLRIQGAVTLAEGARYDWEYGSTNADSIQVTGAVTLPNAATVTCIGSYATPGQWPLFSATNLLGAADLSGWTLVNPPTDRTTVERSGNTVQMVVRPPTGFMIIVD